MGCTTREKQPLCLASDGIFILLVSLEPILCGLLNVDIAYDETDFLCWF